MIEECVISLYVRFFSDMKFGVKYIRQPLHGGEEIFNIIKNWEFFKKLDAELSKCYSPNYGGFTVGYELENFDSLLKLEIEEKAIDFLKRNLITLEDLCPDNGIATLFELQVLK